MSKKTFMTWVIVIAVLTIVFGLINGSERFDINLGAWIFGVPAAVFIILASVFVAGNNNRIKK